MPGLPQEIIIDLNNLIQYPINSYQSFGVFCWHGYNSNPKLIELLISEGNDEIKEYQSLGLYELEQKSGIQIFPIKYNKILENSKNIKFIKIIIKENFGEDWTYINQIMLYDKDSNRINNVLKDSIISLSKNENSQNYVDNTNDNIEIEDIDIQKQNEKNESNIKNNSNSIIENEFPKINDPKNNSGMNKDISYNNNEIMNNEKYNNENTEKNKINNDENESKIVEENISNENNDNFKKSHKVSRIEKILKRNILENENNELESQKYFNTSNNMGDKNKIKNNFFDISQNKILKNVYTNTPNRFNLIKKEQIKDKNTENELIIINNKKRSYTPNIVHLNQEKNDINKISLLNSKDYDNILKTQLKDMENQINLMNKIDLSEIKNNNFNKINNIEDQMNNFGKTEPNNFYFKYNENYNNEINKYLDNKRMMNKTSYNNLYNENKNNKNNFNEQQNNNKMNSNKNYEYNTPPSKRLNKNFFENPKYILNDLASNNTIDINKRLDYLEKSVSEIKKELNSISKLVSNLISGNFLQNNIKENIKLIFEEYINERNLTTNNNESNDHSLYSELLNEEKHQTIEKDINKRIEKKLNKFTEKIKNEIANKYLKPSLNQIEFKMKKNLEEINNKIDEINKYNNFNQSNNNIKYIKDENNFSNKFSGIQSNNNISKTSSMLRNEKYEEINKLGERLYQKLLEKEKKLKLLKKETSKFLND